MKKHQVTILGLSILFGALGIGCGIKMAAQNKSLLVENEQLKKELSCKIKDQGHKKSKKRKTAKAIKANLSIKSKEIKIGDPFIIKLTLSNRSKKTLVLKKPALLWQRIDICDVDGKILPRLVGRIMRPRVPTKKSFITISPGQEINIEMACIWVSDTKKEKILQGTNFTNIISIIDQGAYFTPIKAGSYLLTFKYPAINDQELKVQGKWRTIQEVFNASPYLSSIRSNTLQIHLLNTEPD